MQSLDTEDAFNHGADVCFYHIVVKQECCVAFIHLPTLSPGPEAPGRIKPKVSSQASSLASSPMQATGCPACPGLPLGTLPTTLLLGFAAHRPSTQQSAWPNVAFSRCQLREERTPTPGQSAVSTGRGGAWRPSEVQVTTAKEGLREGNRLVQSPWVMAVHCPALPRAFS